MRNCSSTPRAVDIGEHWYGKRCTAGKRRQNGRGERAPCKFDATIKARNVPREEGMFALSHTHLQVRRDDLQRERLGRAGLADDEDGQPVEHAHDDDVPARGERAPRL